MSKRLSVSKTYKLYIGGKFPRSESGRVYSVTDSEGAHIANASLASRKDARDAVVVARSAQLKWADTTAYLKGQILYRAAEMLEGRTEQFAAELAQAQGIKLDKATSQVEMAIDRLVHYAGWSDKFQAVLSSGNPIAGPYGNHTGPEATGVIAIVTDQANPLYGFIDAVGAAVVSGNAVVVLTSKDMPLAALSFAEVLATSDLPGGVINILSADVAEVAPWLASHGDVDGIDLSGVDDVELSTSLEAAAAGTLKRVKTKASAKNKSSLDNIRTWLEYKTVWNPVGV